MKRTKEQKGITLIALIITIVVLLILAVVAINSITNEGIMSHAGNTASTYNEAVKNEQQQLQNYLDYLDKNNSGSKTYKAYTVGEEVKIVVDGVEHAFYVIEENDNVTKGKVLLLAKGNIDTETLVQDGEDNYIAFSEESYWGEGTSPYPIVEPETIPDSHTAAKVAYDYGAKVGGAGRLMTYKEADDLSRTDFSTKLYETNFWLGSASNIEWVWFVLGMYEGFCEYYFWDDGYGAGDDIGVRPVIEISKDLVS